MEQRNAKLVRVGPDREKRECCAWFACTSAKIKFDVNGKVQQMFAR
jgi:hypothetical protein